MATEWNLVAIGLGVLSFGGGLLLIGISGALYLMGFIDIPKFNVGLAILMIIFGVIVGGIGLFKETID